MARRRLLITVLVPVSSLVLAGAGLAGAAWAAFGHGQAPQSRSCTPGGRKAFTASLIKQFDKTYARSGSFWTAAPSNPSPFGLFSNSATYERPGAAYIALMRILGTANFTRALQHLQARYGGGHITEPQLEAGFRPWLPDKSAACQNRLSQFFAQWFDTAYPSGGGANKPAITGPGLSGPGFFDGSGGCRA